MIKLFRLQHHSHTAKHLPHTHTSYRALSLLLLITGLFITFFPYSDASELQILANIQAEIPTQPATINEPKTGTTTNQNIITISGDCPVITPAILVNIWDGTHIIGTAQCNSDGKYSMFVSLQVGENKLLPKIKTVTGGDGIDGVQITITYIPLSNKSNLNQPIKVSQLLLSSNISHIVFTKNSSFLVDSIIYGGIKPYKMTIDWGDGNTESIIINEAGPYTHKYKYEDSLTRRITFRVFDDENNTALLQITAVNLAPNAITATSLDTRPPSQVTLPYVWIAYVVISLTAFGFWAGESFERGHLAKLYVSSRKISGRRKG